MINQILKFWENSDPINATRRRHAVNLIRAIFPAENAPELMMHALTPLPIYSNRQICEDCGQIDWRVKSTKNCLGCKRGPVTHAVIDDATLVIYDNKAVISRREADRQGRKLYFNGNPCSHGHALGRYVSNKLCLGCSMDNEQVTRYFDRGLYAQYDMIVNHTPRHELHHKLDELKRIDTTNSTVNQKLWLEHVIDCVVQRLQLDISRNYPTDLKDDTDEEIEGL